MQYIFSLYLGLFCVQAFAQTGCILGDCADRFGKYVWENGDSYTGEFKNHQVHGYGHYKFASGNTYAGFFNNGLQEGFGRYTWSNGSFYLGNWKGGYRSGYGKLIFTNGTQEEGTWKKNVLSQPKNHGTGCISGDCQNGEGIYVYANGDLYVGSFQNGKKHRRGSYYYIDGAQYLGQYVSDKCNGDGAYYYPDGGRYVGEFLNCVFHGTGTLETATGLVQDGRWSQGKFQEQSANYTADDYFSMAYKAKSHQEKIKLYTKHLKKKPNSSMGYNNRAWSYIEIGNYQAALNDCTKAIRFNAKNKHAHHTQGMALLKLGRYQKAVDAFERALRLDAEYSIAMRDKRIALKKLGQANTKVNIADRLGPNIHITSPQVRGSDIVTKGQTLLIKGLVKDPSGVRSLLINGYEVALDQPNGKKTTFGVKLTLSTGQNKFWAVAEDKLGNKSPKKEFTIIREGVVAEIPATPHASKDHRPRTALVMGNGNYRVGNLGTQPINDAKDIAKELRKLGFEVHLHTDLQSRKAMKDAVRTYSNRIKTRGGVGLVYYAGHGMQVKGENYLIPTQANPQQEIDVEDEALRLSWLLAQAEMNNNEMNIFIMDACRNNPFSRSWRSNSGGGLAGVTSAPMGTFIAFATAPDAVASNGSGRNGLYTQELLKVLRKPGLSIEKVFKQVRFNVSRLSNKLQIPWENSSIVGDFYFKK